MSSVRSSPVRADCGADRLRKGEPGLRIAGESCGPYDLVLLARITGRKSKEFEEWWGLFGDDLGRDFLLKEVRIGPKTQWHVCNE